MNERAVNIQGVLNQMNISIRKLTELLNAQGFRPNKFETYKLGKVNKHIKEQIIGEEFKKQVKVALQTHLNNQQQRLNEL